MVRASTSEAVSAGVIQSLVKPMTLKLVFTAAFSFDAEHRKDSVENKPASLLGVPSGKALSGGFPHLGKVDRWPTTSERARYSALIAF